MSHWGPLTAYSSFLKISLRICTPLLPLPLVRRTWKLSSKSLYVFLLHRKVLNLMPLPVSPTRAPSLTDQYSVSPSQPSRFLPLKNAVVSLSAAVSSPRPVPLPSSSSPPPSSAIRVERMCCLRLRCLRAALRPARVLSCPAATG